MYFFPTMLLLRTTSLCAIVSHRHGHCEEAAISNCIKADVAPRHSRRPYSTIPAKIQRQIQTHTRKTNLCTKATTCWSRFRRSKGGAECGKWSNIQELISFLLVRVSYSIRRSENWEQKLDKHFPLDASRRSCAMFMQFCSLGHCSLDKYIVKL